MEDWEKKIIGNVLNDNTKGSKYNFGFVLNDKEVVDVGRNLKLPKREIMDIEWATTCITNQAQAMLMDIVLARKNYFQFISALHASGLKTFAQKLKELHKEETVNHRSITLFSTCVKYLELHEEDFPVEHLERANLPLDVLEKIFFLTDRESANQLSLSESFMARMKAREKSFGEITTSCILHTSAPTSNHESFLQRLQQKDKQLFATPKIKEGEQIKTTSKRTKKAKRQEGGGGVKRDKKKKEKKKTKATKEKKDEAENPHDAFHRRLAQKDKELQERIKRRASSS